MLAFIALGILIPLCISFYIRRGRKTEESIKPLYDNKYLKEYLELSSDISPLEQYKILIKASTYLIEKEEEIETECKVLYSLFYARMISNTMWEHLKNAKEELAMDKITIEAELGRFSKIDKSNIERPGKSSSASAEKTTISCTPSKEDTEALYQRIKLKQKSE
ncbi:hypothetical protein NEMIN01_0743 [Nematocida minor]|uniref:uncharacterized protein n=1 Tax=Nematocida minor TaxID=1912983 RepID=UPI002220AA1E|nr:uncharacterized protein NEMIN01_0743 [Nematocida minor]KAI5189880.1 hypothetical protein NEMIN01_0743 [Nematocida minor]